MTKLCIVFWATAAISLAQIGTSTITGRVTDSSGAVIPGVNVSIVQKATNFTSNVVTNSEGIYRVPSLIPGSYRVSFEASGFKRVVNDDVELRTGDTLAVDAAMQVGQITESVEVTSAAPLLETETSSTRTVMSGEVLYEMPLYQRYINTTMNLTPGMSQGGYAYGGSLGSYHLAGQRSGAIGIFEDGVVGASAQGGVDTIKPLQNSVAEVNVITTVPPAEYGHSAGGVISVVKKSGTNELHGMASWYGRTRIMQHRRYFDRARTTSPVPGKPDGLESFFMQPDGNLGGPVVIPKLYNGRDKTFFFVGYQRLHEKKYAQVFTSVPDLDMRQGLFNFRGANPIYDPATTRRLPDGTWTRDPFPDGRIPLNRIDPVARNVLQADPWVDPNQTGSLTGTGPQNNVLADEFARTFFNDWNLRMDHQFSPAFRLNGSFTMNELSGFGRPVAFDQTVFDASQGNYSPVRTTNTSVGYTWLVSPSLINDSRVGYYTRRTQTQVPSFGQGWPSQLGIPNVDDALMPSFGFYNVAGQSADSATGPGIYGITGATPNNNLNENISFRNDTTWIRGSHAFKFGYEILQFRAHYANFARFTDFDFANVTAALQPSGQPVPNTGIPFAGLLTGYVNSATFNSELTSWLPRSTVHSFYIQDDWKVTPTLTLNLGVRYSNESPFNTQYNLMSNFDPDAIDDVTGRKGAIVHPTSGLNKRDSNNFNPRIGVSWHPLEKWVFRGGFGMYTVDNRFPQSRGQFDEYVATAVQQSLPGNPTPAFRLSEGPAPVDFNVRPDGSSPFLGTNFGGRTVEWWDPNLRNPYTMNWNGGVQYEFTRNYLLDITYQGSAGVGLLERWNANTFPLDFAANDPQLRAQAFAAPQNFRPFPHFGDIRMRSNFGHSTYHAGTIKVDKRYSQGLVFSTFYTFSKAINSQDNDNDGSGVAPIQNRSLEKARAGYDRTHRFVASVNYELPFGRGKRWANSGWKNMVIGGFEISVVQTLESGNPLNFSFANSPYNYWPTFAGSRRPDVVSDMDIREGWVDVGPDRFSQANSYSVFTGENNGLSNFALPGGCPAVIPAGFDRSQCDFRIGNAGRNIVTGTPLRWTTVSAQKNFRINERWNAQLRWDMQNAFKTFNFNTPNTTVDFRNPQNFGKVTGDPTTASFGGQPLMNLTVMIQF
jgi:Carboxypeptidase regulatory-like domain/TonB dependent receptor